jgi:hypothetical protein
MTFNRKTSLLVVPVAFTAFALILSACSNQPTTPDAKDLTALDSGKYVGQSQEQVRDLLVPIEDLAKFESNSPIWRTLANDQIYDDKDSPLNADPATISDAFFEIYSVRAVWGQIGDVTGGANLMMDWSGGMTHNSAAMMVLRSLIDFEHGQDSVFRRDNVPGIFWKSATGGDDAFDGVHVELYHPKDVVYIVEPWLVFKAGPVELTIPFSQLADLDTVITLSDGIAVSIQSRLVRTRDCPSGYLAGAWVNKSETAGHFYGKWIASDGQPMGYLRGEFGTTDDGSRWFAGHWYSNGGDLQGYLKGEWGYRHEDYPHPCLACDWRVGWFRGRFSDAEGNDRGHLRGRFGRHDGHPTISADGEAGLFFGKWEIDCPSSGSN